MIGYSRLAKRRDPAATRNPLVRKIGKAHSKALTIDASIDLTLTHTKHLKLLVGPLPKSLDLHRFRPFVGLISGHVLGRVIYLAIFSSEIHPPSIKIHRLPPHEAHKPFSDRPSLVNPSNLAAFFHERFLFLMVHFPQLKRSSLKIVQRYLLSSSLRIYTSQFFPIGTIFFKRGRFVMFLDRRTSLQKE